MTCIAGWSGPARAVLAVSCGDYPALGKVLRQEIGNSYNGCYECTHMGEYVLNLPADHPFRLGVDQVFGEMVRLYLERCS